LIPPQDENGKMYDFVNSGLYDALFVMEDKQTLTLWNHFTGEGMYGPHAGDRMPLDNLFQMSVTQALAMDSSMLIALSGHEGMPARDLEDSEAELMEMFSVTLGSEDDRRSRMEMGLGVWSEGTYRFYPIEVLRENNRVVIDEFDGKSLLVYLDPVISVPGAFFIDTDAGQVDGRNVVLTDGRIIKDGLVYDGNGESLDVEKPFQVYTRWYGFVMSFGSQNTEVYE
jgi:hypothetical protein